MSTRLTLITLTLSVLVLNACVAGPPWKRWMFEGPPPGKEYTPLYVKGWKDGCHTGTSATSNNFYKFQYKFKQDALLAQNRVYYKGWKDAYDYCQRYMFLYFSRRTF